METHGRDIERTYPDPPPRLSNPRTGGGVGKPFQIAAKGLEIDETANRVRLMKHFMARK